MTIKVYELDGKGDVRVLRPEAPVVPLTTVEPLTAYPPCQCLRCSLRPVPAGGA